MWKYHLHQRVGSADLSLGMALPNLDAKHRYRFRLSHALLWSYFAECHIYDLVGQVLSPCVRLETTEL
jgi:hypothetical protein